MYNIWMCNVNVKKDLARFKKVSQDTLPSVFHQKFFFLNKILYSFCVFVYLYTFNLTYFSWIEVGWWWWYDNHTASQWQVLYIFYSKTDIKMIDDSWRLYILNRLKSIYIYIYIYVKPDFRIIVVNLWQCDKDGFIK